MHTTHRAVAVAVSSILVLSLAATAGCGDERSRSPEGVDRVSMELMHGECGGYCRRITELGADLVGRYRQLPNVDDPGFPPKERSFVITRDEWAGVSAPASAARQQSWESRYGCPDCADQGAWTLTIGSTAGETLTTTLDTRSDMNPAPLQQVIDAIRGLHAEER